MAVYGDNDLYFTWVFVAKRLLVGKLNAAGTLLKLLAASLNLLLATLMTLVSLLLGVGVNVAV